MALDPLTHFMMVFLPSFQASDFWIYELVLGFLPFTIFCSTFTVLSYSAVDFHLIARYSQNLPIVHHVTIAIMLYVRLLYCDRCFQYIFFWCLYCSPYLTNVRIIWFMAIAHCVINRWRARGKWVQRYSTRCCKHLNHHGGTCNNSENCGDHWNCLKWMSNDNDKRTNW